jgi:hypothetical protein
MEMMALLHMQAELIRPVGLEAKRPGPDARFPSVLRLVRHQYIRGRRTIN